MLGLGSATAYAEENYPKFPGLKLKEMVLKEDSLFLTYIDSNGNKVIKKTVTAPSKPNSLEITPNKSTDWTPTSTSWEHNNEVNCNSPELKNACPINVLKNGVKAVLNHADLVDHGSVDELVQEIKYAKTLLDNFSGDPNCIEDQMALNTLQYEYYWKTEVLKLVERPKNRVDEVEKESKVARQRLVDFLKPAPDLTVRSNQLKSIELSNEYLRKINILQLVENPDKDDLANEIAALKEQINKFSLSARDLADPLKRFELMELYYKCNWKEDLLQLIENPVKKESTLSAEIDRIVNELDGMLEKMEKLELDSTNQRVRLELDLLHYKLLAKNRIEQRINWNKGDYANS